MTNTTIMKAPILLVALFALAFARPAHANTYMGYPCNVSQVPNSSYYGNSGYAALSLYTGPACTGSFVAAVQLCSANATACGTSYVNDTVFVQIVQTLHAALVAANQRMWVNTPGTSAFITTIYFYAAGY
jgi:hypothetical protein